MILGSPLGRFPLGVIADLNDVVLLAVEDDDIAAFVGIAVIVGDLEAFEDEDIAAFAGRATTVGVLAATEDEDDAAFIGQALDVITGDLAAIEDEDTAEINLLRGELATLAATEEEDTAEFKTWALPFGACQPRTVCLTGQREHDPDLTGTQYDRDTDLCRNWPKKAA